MLIALYGGSFNPPHLAHQLAITCVLSTAHVDELWMVPTFKHPFDKQLAPFEDRVRMCERAAAPFARVRVSRIEEELGGESFTLRTVQALRARHPELQLALVIGADLVTERERWHGWSELKQLARFIVVGRQGTATNGAIEPGMPLDTASRPPPRFTPLASPIGGVELPPISSTLIRQRIARGEPIDAMVPADVVDYIRERGLYGEHRE
jgi:nicotinate-nucleotide adenylyltransferase